MNTSWNQLYNQVPLNRIKSLYKDEFLLGVRQLLKPWISANLPNINSLHSNPYDFMNGLMQQWNLIHQNVNMPVKVIRYWIESIDVSKTTSSYDQLTQQIIDNFLSEQNIYANGNPLSYQIDEKIQYLRMLNMCNKKSLQRFEWQWQSYISNTIELSSNITELKMEIVVSIQNVIKLLTDVLGAVIQCRNDCLAPFQQIQNLPESCLSRLAEIQVWFDETAEIIWDTRSLLHSMQNFDRTCCAAELKKIHELFTNLINMIMVLETQPPEIITTEKNSPTTLRLLLTLSKFFDVEKLDLDISVFSKTIKKPVTKDVKNKVRIGITHFHVEENSVTRHLKDMKVLKVQRSESNRSDKIVAERYIVAYCLRFKIENMQFNVYAESWPIFVIVNQNQEPLAKAALFWDKLFPTQNRAKSKASVPWKSMEAHLKLYFNSETGCDLNQMHLNSLYEKCTKEIIKNSEFVWSQSCHNFREFKFNFWTWLYGAMRLTRECLCGPWKDGLIDGFMSETLISRKLLHSPSGTFLLRFSESEIGALTPVYVEYNERNEATIKKYVPYSIREFEITNRSPDDPEYYGIGNLIYKENVQNCTLFNGVSKYEAFKNHYKRLNDRSKNGYVPRPNSDSSDVKSLVLSTQSLLSPSSLSPSPLPPSPLPPSPLPPSSLPPAHVDSMDLENNTIGFPCLDHPLHVIPDDFLDCLPKPREDANELVLNTPEPMLVSNFSCVQNDAGSENIHCAIAASNMTTLSCSLDHFDNYTSFYSPGNSSIVNQPHDYFDGSANDGSPMSNSNFNRSQRDWNNVSESSASNFSMFGSPNSDAMSTSAFLEGILDTTNTNSNNVSGALTFNSRYFNEEMQSSNSYSNHIEEVNALPKHSEFSVKNIWNKIRKHSKYHHSSE